MGRAEEAGQPPLTTSARHRPSGDKKSPPGQSDQHADCPPAEPSSSHLWSPGLKDSDVDELESRLVDDDFDDDRRHADNARRRLEDQAWVDDMTRNGFTGLVFEVFWSELAAYGIAVMMAWTRTGEIAGHCARIGRPVLVGDLSAQWSRDDRLEIAVETVARALRFYMDNVLVPGRWDHRRGASLRTFFVGACLLQFPNVFNLWAGEQNRWRGIHDDNAEVPDGTDEPVFSEAVWSDPTYEAVVRRHERPDMLNGIPDPVSREAVHLVMVQGMSHAEAAKLLGITARAVEGRVRRARSKMNPPTRPGG